MEDTAAFKDRYLPLGGGHRVRYWQCGEQGTPIVLVHALGASVEYWARVMPTLAQRHRVFALDLLGFGLSDKPDVDYGEAFLAGVVRQFVDALGLQRFHLVGNSMGGAVAQRVARELPRRVDHLALVCSGGLGFGINPRVRLLSVPLVGEFLARPRREMTRRLVLGCVVHRQAVPSSLLEASFQHARSRGALRAFLRTLRGGIRLDGQRPDIVAAHRAAFPHLRLPVMVMWADRDPMVPTDYLDAIQAMPRLRVHRFEDCGHYPQLEQPEAFCDALLNFLGSDAETTALAHASHTVGDPSGTASPALMPSPL